MSKILHTRNMEEAARALAGGFERVLIRNKNVLWNPIRLRRAKLADLAPRIVLNPPEFDSELRAWNKDGGLLIYDRAFRVDENIAAHHAQLVAECPLSIEELEEYLEGTRELAVVYRPPNWHEHERCVGDIYPKGAICEEYYRLVEGQRGPVAEMCGALGLEEAGARIVSDEWVMATLDVNLAQLWRIRNATLRKRDWKQVTQVTLRIEPEDRALGEIYRFIERECPQLHGVHLIVGSSLMKATRFWKVALRNLERRGAIARGDTLFVYFLDGLEPDFTKIERAHAQAKARLADVRLLIEGSEEFSPPATTSSRSPARPDQSQSTSCASS